MPVSPHDGTSMAARLLLSTVLVLVSAIVNAQPSPPDGLRIVVIAGEDAVNVVQQRTAVAPIVEVRDRNNLPVPGAVVTFSIQGGSGASFGGASTVSVATNAAGQAAVTSLTPTAAGAIQIQVSAAFQGQVATATIAQTNVMTAAQAAATASSGGGSGAAGAGGGGLSTTAIVATGAAITGGAIGAVKVAQIAGAGDVFTGTFTGQTSTVSRFKVTGVLTCVVTRAITATVRVEIGDTDGRMEIAGSDRFVSNTCPFNQDTMEVDWEIALTGTSAIRGSDTETFSLPDTVGGRIQGTSTRSFEGTRNGDTVTGTLRLEVPFESTDRDGNVFEHLTTGSFPLTLTRTRS